MFITCASFHPADLRRRLHRQLPLQLRLRQRPRRRLQLLLRLRLRLRHDQHRRLGVCRRRELVLLRYRGLVLDSRVIGDQ
jgi:hypothetical protein